MKPVASGAPTRFTDFRKVPLAIALAIALIDQLTKLWVVSVLPIGIAPIVVVPGFCHILHLRNPGGAWGLLARFPHLLTGLSVIVAAIIVWRFDRLSEGRALGAVGLALALGGILGNLVDRMLRIGVVDFIQFTWGELPLTNAINVADVAITGGVILYAWSSFRKPAQAQPAAD